MIDLESMTAHLFRPWLRSRRRMTKLLRRYYEKAKRHGLNDPLGRAIVCVSRARNETVRDPLATMRSVVPSRAERWRRHWLAGGDLKSLSRTHAERLRLRRERYADDIRRNGKREPRDPDPTYSWDIPYGEKILARMEMEQKLKELDQ